MGDFFNFRKMITPILIKILYAMGAVVILIGAFIAARDAAELSRFWGFVVFVIVFIIGQIVWRMVCEGVILFFEIHNELVKMNRGKDYSTSSPSLEKLQQVNATTSSRHSPAPSPPPSSRFSSTNWVCSCGASNPSFCTGCETCGKRKSSGSSVTDNKSDDFWVCSCGKSNSLYRSNCSSCGKTKQ